MGSASLTVRYEYDAAGNRSLMIDPDGGRTTYAYDSLNRISSLINPQAERTSYTYDANGRQTLKKLANGSRGSFTYDAASNLTTLANLKSNNSVISQFNYQYDNVGNRVVSVEADNSRVSWSYDNVYQLTKEHRTGTSAYENHFSYDAAGNRLVKNEDAARTTSTYDVANQLQTSLNATGTTTYSYDADGNQRLVQTPAGNRTTTIWNYENKNTIVELPTGIRNTMSYEPDGLRTKLEESTGIKKFVWDNQNYLAETDANNNLQVIFTNAPAQYGNLISQRRSSATSYYHYEALGSTRELSDSIEAITDTYLYDAWGNTLSKTGNTTNPFQWTGNVGYYFEKETENYYIRARTYQPMIGRWLSQDPLRFLLETNAYLATFVPAKVDPSGLLVAVGPEAAIVSFINLDNAVRISFEDLGQAARRYSPNGYQAKAGDAAIYQALIQELIHSANPAPSARYFSWLDLLNTKEFRGFNRLQLDLVCGENGVKGLHTIDSMYDVGWTPIRPLGVRTAYYDRAEGRGAVTLINSTTSCVTVKSTLSARISWVGQLINNLALSPGGIPFVWADITYTLCCEACDKASYDIEYSASHFPSHFAYLDMKKLEPPSMQSNLGEFIFNTPNARARGGVFHRETGSL